MPDMRHIKVGDKVKRQFGPTPGPAMVLIVTEIDDELIYCGPKGTGWSFDVRPAPRSITVSDGGRSTGSLGRS